MAELNVVDTGPGGAVGLIQTPYLQTQVPGYNYGTGNGYLEFGSGTAGSLPFRVDQNGNVTAAGVIANLNPSGDTTGATDTAAIQAAMNAVPVNGGTVQLAPGVFYLNATLNPTVTGTILAGSGWGTQLRYDGSVTSPAIGMADTTTRRMNIRWLRISQTNATANGTAVEASYFTDSVIENVLIDGGGTSGVAPLVGISFNVTGTFYNVVSDSRVSCSGANSIGIRFDSASNSNVVRNCRIFPDASVSSSIGIYVNSRAIELDHADIESSAGTGISLGATGHGCTIIAPYLESNGTNLSFASGVNCPTVIGGTIENGTTADITDSGALNPKYINVRSSSGGEHSVTKAVFTAVRDPSDVSFISWTWDPVTLGSNTSTINGTLYLAKLPLRYAATITNLAVVVDTAATTPTANENFLLLFNSSGTLVGQTTAGAIDTATASTGLLKQAMTTPYAAAPGYYWVGCYFNAATPLKLLRGSGEGGSVWNAGVTASNYWWAVNGTGLTTTPPASITPGNNSLTNAIPFWAGIS